MFLVSSQTEKASSALQSQHRKNDLDLLENWLRAKEADNSPLLAQSM